MEKKQDKYSHHVPFTIVYENRGCPPSLRFKKFKLAYLNSANFVTSSWRRQPIFFAANFDWLVSGYNVHCPPHRRYTRLV